jgi:clan AA aspartic protease (TIGR02281 family)
MHSVNLGDGKGNFYLKPNGALLVTDKDVVITESSQISRYSNILQGVQSGPMLLIDGNYNPQLSPGSSSRNIRCGVGIYNDNGKNVMVFCLSNDRVTLYNFAQLFKEHFHCTNALCMESAGCVIYHPAMGTNTSLDDHIIGNYIVYSDQSMANQSAANIVKIKKVAGGTYEVPVELNGVLKIKFMFDSGASDVSLPPDVAQTLIKAGTISNSDFIGSQRYSFADGSTALSQVFILHRIKIGNKTIYNVRASIASSSKAPMLLGQSVLQQFGKFTIDNVNQTLTIE